MSTDHTPLADRERIRVTFQPTALTEDKLRMLQELDAVVIEKLFGEAAWPVTGSEARKLSRRLIELGLDEKVDHNTTQSTALGRELHVRILMAFLGLWASYDLVSVLEANGLIEPQLANELLETMESEYEPLLKEHVVAAYRAYYRWPRYIC